MTKKRNKRVENSYTQVSFLFSLPFLFSFSFSAAWLCVFSPCSFISSSFWTFPSESVFVFSREWHLYRARGWVCSASGNARRWISQSMNRSTNQAFSIWKGFLEQICSHISLYCSCLSLRRCHYDVTRLHVRPGNNTHILIYYMLITYNLWKLQLVQNLVTSMFGMCCITGCWCSFWAFWWRTNLTFFTLLWFHRV